MIEKDKIEIRLGGTGGQGLITAAIILADAAVKSGKNVVQTQSYGPEARGGSSKAEVIISNNEIAFPKVRKADILLVMSQEAAKKYGNEVSPGSIVVSDSDLVHGAVFPKAVHFQVPITMLAKEKVGNEIAANIIALGIVACISNILNKKDVLFAITNRLPAGTRAMNKKAFNIGWKVAVDIATENKKKQLATG